MAIEIGAKGLAEVNLTIPQGTSLTFDVEHTDEDGNPVDHSSSTFKMRIVTKDGSDHWQLDGCCEGTTTGARVSIPASTSLALPVGKLLWDMLVTTSTGDVLRLCYGACVVIDTYAGDE